MGSNPEANGTDALNPDDGAESSKIPAAKNAEASSFPDDVENSGPLPAPTRPTFPASDLTDPLDLDRRREAMPPDPSPEDPLEPKEERVMIEGDSSDITGSSPTLGNSESTDSIDAKLEPGKEDNGEKI